VSIFAFNSLRGSYDSQVNTFTFFVVVRNKSGLLILLVPESDRRIARHFLASQG
jgi:hypothetical protein